MSFIPARRLVSSAMCPARNVKIAVSFSATVLLEPAVASVTDSSTVRFQSERRWLPIASLDGKW